MVIRRTVIDALDGLRRSSAVEPLRDLLRRLGLLGTVGRAHRRLLASLVVRNGEHDVSVGDAEASFRVRNRTEFARLQSMSELDVIGSLLEDLEPDDVFYDVGANVGVYSCLIGDVLPEDSVVSFEPHPGNFEVLTENLNRNGVRGFAFQKALSDSEGEVTLSVGVSSHAVSPGHNLIELTDSVEEYGAESVEQTTVDTVRGDALIDSEDLPPPTVLKVDVEGAEFAVLKGLEDTLAREECRLVYCEVHSEHLPKFGASESELHDLLKSCGFTLGNVNENAQKYHLRAYK